MPCDQLESQGLAITQGRQDFHPNCVLCSFIKRSLSKRSKTRIKTVANQKRGYHLRAFNSLAPLRLTHSPRRLKSANVVIAVVAGNPTLRISLKQKNEGLSGGLLAPQCDPLRDHLGWHGSIYTGKAVTAYCSQFDLFRSWLHDCVRDHGACWRATGRTMMKRLIDCETQKIVQHDVGMQYVALSYVQGPHNELDDDQSTHQHTGTMPSSVPQTIQDAMDVVLQLHRRYLWVDQYCIWDAEDRHVQIQNMHEIYQGAVCTIVAVDGDHAGSGLPGISSPRSTQHCIRAAGGVLFNTFSHLSLQLNTSVWSTRAWTYQEAILSKRCLFFTRDQVYFACASHIRCEAITSSHAGKNATIRGAHLLSYEAHISTGVGGTVFPDPDLSFWTHLAEYTRRALSWDSDALNAFRGVISAKGFLTYWGIPIEKYKASCPELNLVRGLNWRRGTQVPQGDRVRRREGFPTWSWASVVGQIVGYPHYCVRNQVATVRLSDEFERAWREHRADHFEGSKVLWITGNVFRVRLCSSSTRSVYEVFPQRRAVLPPGTALSPPTVRFGLAYIDCEDELLSQKLETEVWDALQLVDGFACHWLLLDRKGDAARRVGIIEMDDWGDLVDRDREAWISSWAKEYIHVVRRNYRLL